jgi:hypothetical protein
MLLFEFERGLLRFTADTPALSPLFQLPPRIGTRLFDMKPANTVPKLLLSNIRFIV